MSGKKFGPTHRHRNHGEVRFIKNHSPEHATVELESGVRLSVSREYLEELKTVEEKPTESGE